MKEAMSLFNWRRTEPQNRHSYWRQPPTIYVYECAVCHEWHGTQMDAAVCRRSHEPLGTPPTNEDR